MVPPPAQDLGQDSGRDSGRYRAQDSGSAAPSWPAAAPLRTADGRFVGQGEDRDCLYRPTQPEDRAGILRLASECFARGDGLDGETGTPSSLARSAVRLPSESSLERLWRWKYGKCPAGNHSQVAIEKASGEVIGHVGGLPYATWCRGRVITTTQSTENMLAPRLRRGLVRVGTFARLVNSWIDTWFGPDRDRVGWGFPSSANFRIGQRFCKYFLIRPVNALWIRAGELARAREPALVVRPVPRFGSEVDALWGRVRRELTLAVERDARHLNWRYAAHPEVEYLLLEARDAASGALRGAAVARAGGLDPTTAVLCDWIVPLAELDTARALLAALGTWAAERDLGQIVTWFPEGVAHFVALQDLGFRVRFTEMISVGRSWDPELSIEDLRRGIYMTPGDMDWL